MSDPIPKSLQQILSDWSTFNPSIQPGKGASSNPLLSILGLPGKIVGMTVSFVLSLISLIIIPVIFLFYRPKPSTKNQLVMKFGHLISFISEFFNCITQGFLFIGVFTKLFPIINAAREREEIYTKFGRENLQSHEFSKYKSDFYLLTAIQVLGTLIGVGLGVFVFAFSFGLSHAAIGAAALTTMSFSSGGGAVCLATIIGFESLIAASLTSAFVLMGSLKSLIFTLSNFISGGKSNSTVTKFTTVLFAPLSIYINDKAKTIEMSPENIGDTNSNH